MDNYSAGAITFASDDIGGVQHTRLKMGWGADGFYGDVSAANPFPVAVQGDTLTALQLIDDMIATLGSAIPAKGTLLAGSDGTNARAVRVTDSTGRLSVDVFSLPNVTVGAALPAGGNNIGTVNVGAISAGSTKIGRVELVDAGGDLGAISAAGALLTDAQQSGTWAVSLAPRASGGNTIFRRVATASTNSANVVAVPKQVYEIIATNSNAAARYLKLYNTATTATVGTDVPVLTILLPPGATTHLSFPHGLGGFTLGIAMALVTGHADSDTGAVSANEHVVQIAY